MKTKDRSFRPTTLELENRLVLSGMITPVTQAQTFAIYAEQTAIQTFAQGYQAAVTTTLLAPNTNPANNRAVFDSEVNGLLLTLQTSLTSAVRFLPNAANLTTDIDAIVTGNSSKSLESELDALTTPTAPATTSAALFEAEAIASIGLADANLTSDLLGYGTITPID